LPDKDLAYFNEGTEHFDDYVEAVSWAQEFAMYNRKLMMEQIVDAVADSGEVPEFELTKTAINCHHNYCIPASEIIPTPAGPKTITELKPGDNVYSFEPQQGLVETRVVRWVASGKKRIFTIRTKHRRVRVSDDHPLLMIQVKMGAHPDRAWHLKGSGSYIWKRARDLRVGDILVCAHGYYSSTNLPVGNGLARFIGAFLGDGWIRQQTASGYTVGLAIGNREAVVTQKYAKLLADELFPEAHWFNNVPGAFGLTCSSKAVHSAVIDMELGYPSADKYLPNHCFSLPLEEKNLFWLAILMLMAALRTAGDDFPPAAAD
jgi:tRNA-splicing ligase RtcB